MKENLTFTKMNGAGNDFVVIDNRDNKISVDERRELAIELCQRGFSVGADGLIFILNKTQDDVDFTWDFINSDGSRGEMCGNGARCAARYAHERNIAPAELSFLTLAGIIKAKVKSDKSVSLEMTDPENFRADLSINIAGQDHLVDFLDTGVPHAIVYLKEDEEISDFSVAEWGLYVRKHQLFAPKGTNANFVKVVAEENTVYVRTYERGVEAETMACGTASVAAAICGHKRYGLTSPVEVITRGGDSLKISFTEGAELSEMAPLLSGPAKIVYEAKLSR